MAEGEVWQLFTSRTATRQLQGVTAFAERKEKRYVIIDKPVFILFIYCLCIAYAEGSVAVVGYN